MFRRRRDHNKDEKKAEETSSGVLILGGVYHTNENELTPSVNEETTKYSKETMLKLEEDTSSVFYRSQSTIDTKSSDSSESSSDDDDTFWMSSGSPSHHTGAPLLVRSAVSERHLNGSLFLSDEEVLGRIMIRSRNLPRTSDGYFASNHVMINSERTKRRMVPLKRNRAMDDIARQHASQMAKAQTLFHADQTDLLSNENVAAKTRVGSNVGRGSSVVRIHKQMMNYSVPDKNNIIDRRFVSMGVGTAIASDGTLYLCQIFSD